MSSKSKHDFSGKVVLLTGSSSGIGAEVARQFALAKAKVVITGLEEDEVHQMVEEIREISGEKPFFLVGSLLEVGFVERLVSGTIDHYGRIDVLFNNAGRAITEDSLLSPNLMSKYDAVMDLNFKTYLKLIHLCVAHLESSKGCVINNSSLAGFAPSRLPLYSCSKAAVNMLTKCAAVELGDKGIRVNSVNPGPIRTNFGRCIGRPDLFLGAVSSHSAHTIMKRNGEVREVANLVMFLASSDASYITGANYLVDGGYTCI